MKKKFSMFTIALAASLGLVACGSNEGGQGTTNGEEKIKVFIKNLSKIFSGPSTPSLFSV